MFVSKIKAVLSVVLLLAVMAEGTTLLTCRTAAGQEDKKPTAEKPMEPPAKQESKVTAPVPKQDKGKEELTAWGKEVGGLQAGLGYEPGAKRVHRPGETVKLVVRVRNVGKEKVSFQYLRHFFIENPPTVTDDKGKVTLKDGSPKGIYKPVDATLAPEKEIELYELSLTLGDKAADTPQDSTLYGEGKFQIQYERVLGDSSLSSVPIKTDPKLQKLATGKLDLVVSRWIRRAAAGQEKEAFTAWGKEAGGLQAGLGFRPGEHRAYHHNEAVTLVVRVRNVGKEDVKFSYFNEEYYENPPTVTDARDKPVPLEGAGVSGLAIRIDVNLGPGKQVDLCEVHLALRPAGEKGNGKPVWTLFGTGKFQLQYDRAGGNIRDEKTGPDPILSKLATGKLELEVTTDPPPAGGKKSPAEQKQEKEGFTAWGKAVGGLQAGLGFRPGEQRAYHPGETVKLVVRVRNVGKKEVTASYYKEFFDLNQPVVTDSDGKPVDIEVASKEFTGPASLKDVTLPPGAEVTLGEICLAVRPFSDRANGKPVWTIFGLGKFQVNYPTIGGNSRVEKGQPDLRNLAAGKLELEVKEADGKKQTEKDPTAQPKNDQDTKAVFTRLKGRWTLFEALQIQGNRKVPHDESLSFDFADATFRQFQSEKATGDGAVEVDLAKNPPNLRLRFRKPDGGFSGAELAGPMDFHSDDELWIAICDTSIRTAEAMLAQPRVVWKLKRAPAFTKEQTDSVKKVKEIQKERIATLKKAAEVSLALAQRDRLEVWEAVEDRVALLKAELEVAETEADLVTLYKKTLDDLKVYEAVAKARLEAARGSELALHKVKAKRLETEIALEQAKMKQAKDGK